MEIRNTITNKEASELIEHVVEACIVKNDEDGTFQYVPHLKDYAERVYMLQYFGGMGFKDEQESLDAAYGDIYKEVSNACYEQWDGIEEAIDRRISSILDSAKNRTFERIADGIEALVKKESPIDNLVIALTSLINSIGDNLGDIDMKQFASDIKKISVNPTSEDLVNALINAKMIQGDKYNG